MKRISSFILLMAMIFTLPLFNSCTVDTPSDESTDDFTNQTPETTIEETEHIVIAENGEDLYKIIRYIDASTEEVDIVLDFRNDLNERYKLSFALGTDWSAPNSAPPEDACEIIVGVTERKVSTDVIAEHSLGYGDCVVSVRENNKIVIVAPNYTDLTMGFEYFMSNLKTVKSDDGNSDRLVYTGGNYVYKAADEYIWSDGATISDYRIVYDKDGAYKQYAEKIAESINANYGIKLKLVSEAEAKADREIIVGAISDPDRTFIDPQSLSPIEYIIATSDKSIFIGGKTETAVNGATKGFIDKFIKTGSIYSLNLPCNTNFSFNSFSGGEPTDLVDGADTRIMSFNILSEEWDSAAVLPGRDVRVPAILLNYLPDVAALQEVSNKWYPILKEMLGSTYAFTREKTPSGSGTYTTLVYNKNTTKLIEHGMELYSVGNSQRLRSIVWGLFESIQTGERYIVFSTHWDPHAERQAQRIKQAEEMAEFVKEYASKYKVDIFACGDYNAKESSTEYKTFTSKSGFVDAKKAAAKINRACTTYHTLFQNVNTSSFESIDHITFSQDTAKKVLYYNTLIADYVIDASDHCPIYIDVKLAK